MNIHAKSRSTCLYPHMAIPYSYLTHVCSNLNYINKFAIFIFLFKLPALTDKLIISHCQQGAMKLSRREHPLAAVGNIPKV